MVTLKLNTFKELYKLLKSKNSGFNKGLLVILILIESWYVGQTKSNPVDEKVIEFQTKEAVDAAISEYEAQEVLPDNAPIYSESLGGEMRLTAPWYQEKNDKNV
jgi:hypothetical protein